MSLRSEFLIVSTRSFKAMAIAASALCLAQSATADEKTPTAEINSFTWETTGTCTAKCDREEKPPVSKPVTKEVIVSGEGGTTI